MKRFLKVIMGAFLSNSLISATWVLAQDLNKEELFPEQPCLVYDPAPSILNPFKMPARSMGVGAWGKRRNITEVFSQTNRLSNLTASYIDLKIEMPYYRDKVSLGFEVTQACHETHLITLDWKTFFTQKYVHHHSVLGTLKGRLPFYTPIGHVALTLTPKAGLVYMTLANDVLNGIGVAGGLGVGVDYYFNQWLGCYFEYSAKYNYVPFLISKNHRDPYHLSTTSFTIGLKTTL